LNASCGKNDNEKKRRLGWLDFGKIMGMFVVLLVHAECSLGPVTFYGGMFCMPVFFVASGYTCRQKEGETYRDYIKKKAQKLLGAYFGTSALLWLFFWLKDSVLTGRFTDLKLRSVFGIFYSRNQMFTAQYTGENPVLMDILNAPLWFLTAMFLTYAWYGIVSRCKRKYLLLVLGVAASIIWHYSTSLLLPWSLEAIPLYTCFFVSGVILRQKKKEELLGELWFLGVLLVVFLITSQLSGTENLSRGNYGNSIIICLFAGTTGSWLVFAVGMWLERVYPPIMKLFTAAGQETLLILCSHMFLFMLIRTGAAFLGFGPVLTTVVLVAGGFVLPTGIGKILHGRSRR